MSLRTVTVIIIFAHLLNCCDDNNSQWQIHTYPAANGNEWHYQTTFFAVKHDSAGVDTTIHSRGLSTVRLQRLSTFYGFNDVFELHVSGYEVSSDTTFFDSISVWYRLTDSTLKEIANVAAGGSPIVFPKSSRRLPMQSTIGLFSTFIATKDTAFRTRTILEFPLEKNRSWISFDDVWLQIWTVEEEERVVTPSGTSKAFKIRHDNFGVSGQYEYFSYFAENGLVKRESIFKNAFYNSMGDSIGYVDFIDLIELVDFTLTN